MNRFIKSVVTPFGCKNAEFSDAYGQVKTTATNRNHSDENYILQECTTSQDASLYNI